MAKIAIIIEGGVVQDIVSDDPKSFDQHEIVLIDYDVDGSDPNELFLVPQDDGTVAEAIVNHVNISQATVNLDNIEPAADVECCDEIMPAPSLAPSC